MNQSSEVITTDWYQKYYNVKGADRNDILRNPGVLFQILATEKSIIEALRTLNITNRLETKILDIGCGTGSSLLPFLRCGFSPHLFSGIDIQADRIEEAKKLLPSSNLICGDATKMPFESSFFDISFESTMFMQIVNDDVRKNLANEICRVTKKSGYIILTDWTYSSPFSQQYRSLTRHDITTLFGPNFWRLSQSYSGAMIPPIGRFFSTYLPSLYFSVAKLPFMTALKTHVLYFKNDVQV